MGADRRKSWADRNVAGERIPSPAGRDSSITHTSTTDRNEDDAIRYVEENCVSDEVDNENGKTEGRKATVSSTPVAQPVKPTVAAECCSAVVKNALVSSGPQRAAAESETAASKGVTSNCPAKQL